MMFERYEYIMLVPPLVIFYNLSLIFLLSLLIYSICCLMIFKEKFVLLEQEVENYSEWARLISRY